MSLDRSPLWRKMHDSFWQCPQDNWRLSSAYMIRAVAKWIEESQVEDYGVLLPDVREVIERLTAEAKRAEKGE